MVQLACKVRFGLLNSLEDFKLKCLSLRGCFPNQFLQRQVIYARPRQLSQFIIPALAECARNPALLLPPVESICLSQRVNIVPSPFPPAPFLTDLANRSGYLFTLGHCLSFT